MSFRAGTLAPPATDAHGARGIHEHGIMAEHAQAVEVLPATAQALHRAAKPAAGSPCLPLQHCTHACSVQTRTRAPLPASPCPAPSGPRPAAHLWQLPTSCACCHHRSAGAGWTQDGTSRQTPAGLQGAATQKRKHAAAAVTASEGRQEARAGASSCPPVSPGALPAAAASGPSAGWAPTICKTTQGPIGIARRT